MSLSRFRHSSPSPKIRRANFASAFASRQRMQCTIGISQRVTFSARILRPADIESISYTSIVAPANNVGVTPRAAMEHEFVNANMSRAALSVESLLLRLINVRAACSMRLSNGRPNARNPLTAELIESLRRDRDSNARTRCWHVACSTQPANSAAVLSSYVGSFIDRRRLE